jgi:hypothetical protein
MSNTNIHLSDLVIVDAGFKPAVHLPDDFDTDQQNAQLIRTYIPTSQSITFLAEVARSLNPVSNERARMLSGTFGTGKSDLLLLLCNYFLRPVDDPIMQPFYEKLKRINEAQYTTIYQQRANKKPFLVVLLQANAVTPFPGFILHGLEQALKRAGLDDLMLPTRYAAASQKIEEWQRESHPVLQNFIAELRDNETKELSTLVKDLGSPAADLAFPSFQRAFRKATGTAFDIYSYDRPEQTYKRVAQALRERGSHSGILVVCDEFTEILRRLARASDQQASEIEAEALGVQDLANTSISSSQNQLHFVISALESFASSSAESTSGTGSKVVEKIGGRFKTFELELQDSAELIRGAIQRLDETVVLPNRQRDELVELARTLTLWRQQGKQWATEMVVDGCFPLHPLVTYALPLVNSRVAQNNRTMFQFLKDKEGLSGFLAQHQLASPYPDWNNLLTLDWLFDYFEKSIQVRRSDITDAYNHSLQLLDRANVDTSVARRVLKAVALCEVIEPNLSPTRQLLRHALNLPPSAQAELMTALSMLEQAEAIYPPSDAEGEAIGAYSLPMAGRVSSVNLRQRVIHKARESHTNVLRLQAAHPAHAIEAKEYNQRRSSYRELKAKYVSLAELSSATRLKQDLSDARDGLLWYMVASSENERSDAQSRARELTRQNPRLIVAVPIAPLTVLEALKNYEALQEVRSDTALDSNAKAYLQDTGRVGQGFKDTLTAAITKLREEKQWEWFREGVSQPNITSASQTQDLASKVMSAVYPNTPEHQLSQNFKAEGYPANLTRAVTAVIKGELRISKSGSEVVIRKGMTALGLVKQVGTDDANEIFSVTEPTGAQYHSQKIWQLYVSYLTNKKPWAKLIDTLRKEPYGLYDSLLITFTAAFLTFHADGIEITTTAGQPSALDERVLKALIESPQNYNVRLQPLTEPDKQWLQGVITQGLKKPFDRSGGQGKTLRARVAAQVKTWLAGLHLPLFAEKLDAEQLSTLMPDAAQRIAAAALILLQGTRTDESIASALLNEIPTALNAPEHNQWTTESVGELLAAWAETCRFLERLPQVLEQHATHAVAAVFGCEDTPAARYWWKIYSWRQNRQVVQNRVDQLSSHARTFFRLSNQTDGTIHKSFLGEFAQTIIGINTDYQMWPTLSHLDRLVKEVQKARDEVDTRWRTLASAEDVWHDGLASAALGRPMSGVSADDAAKYLHEWNAGVTWPNCALALEAAELQHFYPALDAQAYEDISAILRRTQHGVEDWKRELGDALPKQFGVEGWTKAEVERAVGRLGVALKHAANLDALLRKHILAEVLQFFATEITTTLAPAEIVRQWHEVHPIPAENDLDDLDPNASIVLGQIASSSDAETTLLITLPRALPQIAKSYQQWQAYSDLQRYRVIVAAAVKAVNSYTPLTNVELRWLTGIVTEALRHRLVNPPREKNRLVLTVGAHIADWLDELHLPAFAPTLTDTELQNLSPEASSPQIAAMMQLLKASEQLRGNPADLLLTDLPTILGNGEAEESLSEPAVEMLLPALGIVCTYMQELNDAITRRLFDEIGTSFGIEAPSDGAGMLVGKLRTWRQSYVLFASETLSPNAALVSEVLTAPTDDPLKLLLTTLPGRLREVRTPYGSWHSWDERTKYLQSLTAAATEIAQRGHVSDATPHVQALWESLKSQIAELSCDEQRWLIKAFSEEFRA